MSSHGICHHLDTILLLISLFGEKRKFSQRKEEVNAACLSKREYDSMKRSSIVVPTEDVSINKSSSPCSREKAKAKKERMIKMDNERLINKKKSDDELNMKRNDMKAGEIKFDNEQSEDIVKLLNTCKQRAAAFAIRDKQLEDKRAKEKEEHDYERLMDLKMEVKRLNDISQREQEEKKMAEKRIADRKVIELQIQERQHQKLLQEEARDQENKKMLETVQNYQREASEKERKRKEDARHAQQEIIRRNKEILVERESKKKLEEEEEEMILAYQAKRDEELRKREEEERESQREKIELQKKLLESQTKSMDKRAEIDELRARRAAEEAERRHRARELSEARKRKKDMDLLLESRQRQEEERLRTKEMELKAKEEEYYNALAQAGEMTKREKYEADIMKKKNAELRSILKKQILENEMKRQELEQKKNKEGKEIEAQMVSSLIH